MSVLSRVFFDPDITAPSTPGGVSATALSTSTIRIAWSACTDTGGSGLSGYRVLRSTTSGGTYTQIGSDLSTASLVFDDTTLSAGQQRFYRVVAFDGNANVSANSATVNATTTAAGGATLESDWSARISGPGVVWYHGFDSAAEVNQFRWTGEYGNDPNDTGPRPNTVRWRSDDGILPGCLEIFRAAGGDDPSNWWRPFSPLNASSTGRGFADPAASGTISLKSFTPIPDGSQTQNWSGGGYYGDSSYHAGNPGQFDGTEYYLQLRVKIDPNRIVGTNDSGGKVMYLSSTTQSFVNQEVVTVSAWKEPDFNGVNRDFFRMYRSGSGGLLISDGGGASVGGNQPGSQYGSGICNYLSSSNPLINNCWYWPLGEWVTLLYHVRLGTDDDPNTLLEVWFAEDGDTQYTRLWSQSNVPMPFTTGVPFGHNAMIASGYMNGTEASINTDFYHRYDQIIFSKNTIPCPQVYSALSTAARDLAAGSSVLLGDTGNNFGGLQWINWQQRFHYDPLRKSAIALIMRQSSQNPTNITKICVYTESTNSWVVTDFNFPESSRSHSWDMHAYDHATGTSYYLESGGLVHRIARHNYTDGPSTWTYFGADPASFGVPTNILYTATSPDSFVSASTAVVFMPNLFGAGDAGLVIGTQFGLIAWRFSVSNYVVLYTRTQWTAFTGGAAQDSPAGTYCRGLDCTFWSQGESGTGLLKIANGPVITQLANTPIRLMHDQGGNNAAKTSDDPNEGQTWYAFEFNGGTNRVWKWNNSTATLQQLSGVTSPWGATDPENFMTAPAYGLGVVFGVEESGSSGRGKLWKPPA